MAVCDIRRAYVHIHIRRCIFVVYPFILEDPQHPSSHLGVYELQAAAQFKTRKKIVHRYSSPQPQVWLAITRAGWQILPGKQQALLKTNVANTLICTEMTTNAIQTCSKRRKSPGARGSQDAGSCIQPADIEWPRGNGKKLSNCQACCLE